jgi:hypothetical protein
MRPVTAPADLFSEAATDGMDRPAARISSNRRSSSSDQGLFCCVGTIPCPSPQNGLLSNFLSFCSYRRPSCDFRCASFLLRSLIS